MDHADAAVRLVVAVFATWRLAHLLAFEDGPFALIARLRIAAGRVAPGFAALLDCFYCLSLWAAAALAPWIATTPAAWLCITLGLSGAACVVQRFAAQPVVLQPYSPEEDHHVMLRTTAPASAASGAPSAHEPGATHD